MNDDNVVGDKELPADFAIDVLGVWDSGKGKYINGNLTIKGSGKLTVDGKTDAVYCNADCKIESGEVKATAAEEEAIYTYIGDCVISGGIVTVSAYNDAIYVKDGDCVINGGKVTATAEKGAGIGTYKDVIISDCEVSATSEKGFGIFGSNNIEISGGKVFASVSNGGSDSHAVNANTNLEIKDARLTASCDSGIAVLGTDLDITYTEAGKRSTYVDASAGNSEKGFPAIASDPGSLSKSENLAITTPKNGSISDYENIATVMDGDKYASHAVIEPYSYKITVADTTGGKAKVEPESAAQGEIVKVVTTPDKGYEVDKIIIIDEDGKETDITEKSAFTMGRSKVTVRVSFKKKETPASTKKPVAAVRGIAKGKTALKFTWNRVDGAASYEVWMSKCDTSKKKYSLKKVKTLSASKTTWTKKKLKKNKAYKFLVVAKDASGNVISESLTGHALTGNAMGEFANAKSLKVSRSTYNLTKGGTAKIKATQKKAKKGKKLLDGTHAALLRYTSNDPYVATVDKSGKITAVNSGSCKVYVQTVNGIWKKVDVKVN